MKRRRVRSLLIILTAVGLCLARGEAGYGARIKDIADITSVRDNQLIGFGLVIGLNGTGDKQQTRFTIQSLGSVLERFGLKIEDRSKIKVKNVASVVVTATLPPFARAGTSIDVTVSSLGDASSLQGGTLLLTPLRGLDGKVYAVAQGQISIGGFAMEGGGASAQKNHPTVGKISSGATVEQEVLVTLNARESIRLILRDDDFTTVVRVKESIEKNVSGGVVKAIDSRTIEVEVPSDYDGRVVELLAMIEGLDIEPDSSAKVVLNERTGTVVMGENVQISTVAISHGNLSIQVQDMSSVSQPAPFSGGDTTVVSDTYMTVEEEGDNLTIVPRSTRISDVVRALNALGVTPRDLISILQAIKEAGALQAELEII